MQTRKQKMLKQTCMLYETTTNVNIFFKNSLSNPAIVNQTNCTHTANQLLTRQIVRHVLPIESSNQLLTRQTVHILPQQLFVLSCSSGLSLHNFLQLAHSSYIFLSRTRSNSGHSALLDNFHSISTFAHSFSLL